MGVSVYPVLNRELPGVDATTVPGKALAAAVFAEGSAFAVLERFSSQNEEELADFIAEHTGQEISEIEVPPEEWFAPEEGLKMVRSLLAQACSIPPSAPDGWETTVFQERLVDDLQNLEKVLDTAQEQGALFYLAIDF